MADRLTILDVAKQMDGMDKVVAALEVLEESSPFLQDAVATPSNNIGGNRTVIRSSLPAVDFTRINKGTPRSKGSYKQVVDAMGILEGRSEVDLKLRTKLGAGNFDQARWNEDAGFLESMAETLNLTFLYGDENVNDASFTGIVPRLNVLSTAKTASKVISASGTANLTSMYVVDWHERRNSIIYPEGGSAGIDVRQLGEQSVNDADGNPFQAAVTVYEACMGFAMRDPRHLGRLANIDVTTLTDAGETTYDGVSLLNKLIDLLSEMPDTKGSKRVIYCSNLLWATFHKLALAKANAALSMNDYLKNGLTPHFWGFPIRRIDRISHAETQVS